MSKKTYTNVKGTYTNVNRDLYRVIPTGSWRLCRFLCVRLWHSDAPYTEPSFPSCTLFSSFPASSCVGGHCGGSCMIILCDSDRSWIACYFSAPRCCCHEEHLAVQVWRATCMTAQAIASAHPQTSCVGWTGIPHPVLCVSPKKKVKSQVVKARKEMREWYTHTQAKTNSKKSSDVVCCCGMVVMNRL